MPYLLPGALMRYPDGVLEMRYRIAGETLEQRLARPFDGAETCELLDSISSALDALVAGQMPLMNLRFAADEVVMDAAGYSFIETLVELTLVGDHVAERHRTVTLLNNSFFHLANQSSEHARRARKTNR